MKIVSLIPSATEIVDFLGLTKNLVGVSHECDSPNVVRSLPVITKSKIKVDSKSLLIDNSIKKILELGLSVYGVNTNILKDLNPDIIITQSQCSVCAVSLNELKKSLGSWLDKDTKLIDLSPNSLNDILHDIIHVGKILNKSKTAIEKVNYIKDKIIFIKHKLKNEEEKKILCIEWLNPVMIAGNWMPDLLRVVNASGFLVQSGQNSIFTSLEKLTEEHIDKVILMPCGFDIKRIKKELQFVDRNMKTFFKNKDVYLVDGNKFFNRPGPSILESLNILSEIIHPNIFKPSPSIKRWLKL